MGQGVPAGDEHRVDLAGVQVGAAQLDRADAGAVLDGQVLDHLPGQRHGHPLRPGRPAGQFRSLVTSVGSSPVQVSDQPHRRHSARAGEVPSSCRIRPVAQTGHGSSVRQAVMVRHAATSGHSTPIRDAPVGQGADVGSR